ncbi:MAG: hypothetical protein HZC42_06470 [Candidatus Eisenbacteria bacterium]|nr:hypothetical protein [Candidatus Eisenbacteria bacterium]
MDIEFEPIEILAKAARILDDLKIPWMVGGSFASSFFGAARFTGDADVVIDMRSEHVDPLARELEREFYVSRDAMREALRDRRSFNAIHVESSFKIDFFVLGAGPFDREEFGRRLTPRASSPAGTPLVFKTPEDSVLRKLHWYRLGGEVSEQQWRDVLGVLIVSRDLLDNAYMDRWAAHLGVTDLLEKARGEAGGV